MQFVFHYPETNGTEGDLLDSGPLDEVARAVERVGFDALSLTEHPIPGARWLESGGHQSLDPFVALAFVAAATERLRLLTHLALAPYRNPFLLAKAAATLDKLSGGRLILGLGAGYQKSEFYALGVDMDERGALFDEVLECLPLHWSGEPFSYSGLHFEAPRRDRPSPPRAGSDSHLDRRQLAGSPPAGRGAGPGMDADDRPGRVGQDDADPDARLLRRRRGRHSRGRRGGRGGRTHRAARLPLLVPRPVDPPADGGGGSTP